MCSHAQLVLLLENIFNYFNLSCVNLTALLLVPFIVDIENSIVSLLQNQEWLKFIQFSCHQHPSLPFFILGLIVSFLPILPLHGFYNL